MGRTDIGVADTPAATQPVYNNEVHDFRVGDVFDVTDCSDGAFVTPTTAAITGISQAAGAVTLTVGTTLVGTGAACKLHLVKDTLVLDSVPDAWTSSLTLHTLHPVDRALF